ncbi:3-(methylthio)propionyl-CoA ligase [Nitratireductor sp. StC3]|uniref:3-(methylthio)propionyl-CoA ligase n=1 Tax=Nitratireductor sp. StC3 TaxID=2126741 RepID=UPI000D0CD995|nr:3-(methylthio)propionyl-CoA ligase [Nitratireductor sp. StC3]PSM18315.1 long-chain fatty acid--CoA ligase [Nitratireductor sp. StC3]
MLGLMQQWPLLCHKILDYAARQHGAREVVSRSVEGPIVRTTYAEIRARALKVAQRLERDGCKPGDRIATLGWNTARHLEAWYGAMGMGGVYHTLNPRLFPEQIAWIMNHAEDKVLFTDLTFMPLVEKIAPSIASLKRVIVLTDGAHMPETGLGDVVAYEDWLAEADGDFQWRDFHENTAAGMCYTSGTTGDPKGVVYSHRSNVLHAMIACLPDAMGISSRDTILPVVPMFHANAWGLAQSGPMIGAKLVMPGGKMDGASIYELLDTEKVTFTAAVPTVWLMLLQYLEETGKTLPHLDKVVIGGSACPRAMTEKFQDNYGVQVIHAWGMTEMSPLGSLGTLKPAYAGLEGDALLDLQEKQGHAPFGVEMKVTDDDNRELPWDGKKFGRLKVRGPAVAASYYGGDGAEQFDEDGWFDTGDVAHIDPQGYMQITDRAKDVIKSGGEWISTIDLENLAVGHPDVAEAAVIGIAHPKWDERPLLVVVKKPGKQASREAILDYMKGRCAKWWLPDDVAFVDEIPHTATGKIQKTALREQFRDYRLPTA